MSGTCAAFPTPAASTTNARSRPSAEVLRGGPQALRIGKNVREFEREVAGLFGKRRGIMCNSGSSALYLAVELLGLVAGGRGHHLGGHVLDRHRPSGPCRAGPVLCRRRARYLQRRRGPGVAEMIGPRTRAVLVPNLIGNAPDWDAIRARRRRHGLAVVEDSCDALGSTLRGTPTGTRSDISVTSFALSHIITAAGTGGMVCLDDDDRTDRCLLLRRWGRRSEVQLFGSREGDGQPVLLVHRRRPRVRQPVHLRRGGMELRALRAVGRLRTGPAREARREPGAAQAQLRAPPSHFSQRPDVFVCRARRPSSTRPGTCSPS